MTTTEPTLVESVTEIVAEVARMFAGMFGLTLQGAGFALVGLFLFLTLASLVLNMSGKTGWSLTEPDSDSASSSKGDALAVVLDQNGSRSVGERRDARNRSQGPPP